ncbi:helix-turn-helix domain-containing protein [Paenibacillus chitinolyticus]|uniref:helix-turn-helix domain-containing protein n=1 Tax=Paenibacillus chitinolyticus TaxID=79263 RepID=UPI001C451EA2|nr:helix-turn-helix transcriptional regulator [Paenibacillus chitinolyticus]MBV6715882.1 helix-turn-helix domain-containing protein [Paenibacillus chitinolyticus]
MLLKLIGERIRLLRREKGLTQEELAEAAGINASYIGTVERGERNISLETLEKVIIGLNVTPTEMFQFHQADDHDLKVEKKEILEVLNSLLYSRSLEENKLIFRVIKDILDTIDYNLRG